MKRIIVTDEEGKTGIEVVERDADLAEPQARYAVKFTGTRGRWVMVEESELRAAQKRIEMERVAQEGGEA